MRLLRVLLAALAVLSVRAEDLRDIASLVKAPFAVEEHTVVSDGYKLALFRVQRSGDAPGEGPAPAPRPPVLLHHGFTSSAGVWFVLPRDQGLPYLLHDAGYDVWALSDRGSTHSQQHEYLSPLQREFWRFTLDDLALVDLPALVDYVLRVTGARRLATVTWSAGSTLTFAMSSQLAATHGAAKLCAHVALGPVTFVQRVQAPLMRLLLGTGIDAALLHADAQLFAPAAIEGLLGPVCAAQLLPELHHPRTTPAEALCQLTAVLGFGPTVLAPMGDFERYSAISWPSAVSVPMTAQYAQMFRRGPDSPVLLRYNYGIKCGRAGSDGKCNQEQYGQLAPPQYDLSKYDVPTTVLGAAQDIVSVAWDRTNLVAALPAGVLRNHTVLPGHAHLDFTWHDARSYAHLVLQALRDACA